MKTFKEFLSLVEDTEQLDELSPGLLSHYKTAANYDVGQKERERGDRHGPRKGSKRRIKLDAKIVKRHKKLGDANVKLKAKLGEPEHGHHWSDPRVNDAHKAGIAHRKKHKLPMPTQHKYYNADGSLHHHYDESVVMETRQKDPAKKERIFRKKIKVQTTKPIGHRIADIGAGGKEYNVRTNAAWDQQKGNHANEEVVMETSLKLKVAALKAQKDPAKKERILQHIRAAHDEKYKKRMKQRAAETK